VTFLRKSAKPSTDAPAKSPPDPQQTFAQDWLPVRDLHDGGLVRPDGAVVAGIQISPYSLTLRSIREQRFAIQLLAGALNGLDCPWQWYSAYRPVDLDPYLHALQDQITGHSAGRQRTLLLEYTQWATQLIRSGQTLERKYYLLMTRDGSDAWKDHAVRTPELVRSLRKIPGFQAEVLTDAGWRELLFLAFHAETSAFTPVPDGLARVPIIAYDDPNPEGEDTP